MMRGLAGVVAMAVVGLWAGTTRADGVMDWNALATVTSDADGMGQAASPTWSPNEEAEAIVAVAIFQAVNTVSPRYAPFRQALTAPASGASAGHAAQVTMFPERKAMLDSAFELAIAALPDSPARREGIAVGERAAGEVGADGKPSESLVVTSVEGLVLSWSLFGIASSVSGVTVYRRENSGVSADAVRIGISARFVQKCGGRLAGGADYGVAGGIQMTTFNPLLAYRRFLGELCNGDFGLADVLVSADCVFHVAGAPESAYRGPEGVRRLLTSARSPFSSLTFRLAVGPVVQGDLLAARWVAEGVYGGGFPGARAAAGTAVSFGGHDFVRFREGQFVEYWGGADDAHLMTQLGMFG